MLLSTLKLAADTGIVEVFGKHDGQKPLAMIHAELATEPFVSGRQDVLVIEHISIEANDILFNLTGTNLLLRREQDEDRRCLVNVNLAHKLEAVAGTGNHAKIVSCQSVDDAQLGSEMRPANVLATARNFDPVLSRRMSVEMNEGQHTYARM